MTETDHAYFRRRAAEERSAAARADHQVAERAHLELAQRYEELAAASTAQVLELKLARGA